MSFITDLFTGGIGSLVKELTGPLERAYQDYLKADTDEKKLAAEQAIAFYKGQIELAQTAAQNDKWWSTRELMAKCVLVLVAKLLVWDTVLGLGVTPDPGVTVNAILWIVIGFYFGSKAATDVATKLLSAIKQRSR